MNAIQQPHISKAMLIGSIAWLFFGTLSTGFMYILHLDNDMPSRTWIGVLNFTLFTSAMLFIGGMIAKTTKHPIALYKHNFITGLALSYILFFFGSLSLSYPIITNSTLLWLTTIASAVIWCLHSLNKYRKRLIDTNFIAREFSIRDDHILIRNPVKTDLTKSEARKTGILQTLSDRFGHYAILGIPLAYPIQSFLSSSYGTHTVAMLLFVIGYPLTLYILGRMTCAAYLWVYQVWRLQRIHGKPVILDAPE